MKPTPNDVAQHIIDATVADGLTSGALEEIARTAQTLSDQALAASGGSGRLAIGVLVEALMRTTLAASIQEKGDVGAIAEELTRKSFAGLRRVMSNA